MTRVGVPSIRARLALWYAASVLAAVLVFAVALRSAVHAALEAEFSASLASSADAVSGFFRLEYGEYRTVDSTLAHIADEVVFPDRVVEFVGPAGRVVFRAVPLSGAARDSTAQFTASDLLPGPIRRLAVPLDTAVARGWTVRVYASGSLVERSLERIDRWMLVGIPLGVLVAAAAGWWLAGRTLRPVGAMAAAVEGMSRPPNETSGRADATPPARLPIANADDELGRLGTLFNTLLDQIDGVLAQQRRFLADAAHELRTPVARMLGSVELALLDRDDSDVQHSALERVHADLDRTARLVDELLQLARADATGVLCLRPAYVDDVVADAVRAWTPVAERRGVRLVTSTLEEAPAMLDAVLVERLVGILVDNAIRYTPTGGTVDIAIASDGAARLTVADTGIGIAADERAHLFDRFYRGPRARSMSPEGTGLGLAIARWIAEAHGATLTLAPRAGGGTVAIVDFPMAASPALSGRG